MKARVAELQKQARARLAALGKRPRLRVLLTGATGFLGKEFLAQAAAHPHVEEVVCVVRPETIRDRKTKEVVRVLSARERGRAAAEAAARDREGGARASASSRATSSSRASGSTPPSSSGSGAS